MIIKKFFKFLNSLKLLKTATAYVFFSGLNGLVPFLLLPIITNYLNPEEYGIANLFQTTFLFMVPLVGLSMGFNIDKLFFREKKDYLAKSISNMLFILLITIFLSFFLILILTFFFDLSFIGFPVFWLKIIPIISGFAAISEYNLILLRNQDKVKYFGFWQIGYTCLNMGLSLFLIISLLKGWEGRVLGIVISTITIGILSILNIRRMGYLTLNINYNEVKKILNLCTPLLFHGLCTFAIFQSNRYFININLNQAAVGIFSVAVAFSSLMGIVKDGLARTLNPWFYKNLNLVEEYDNFKIKVVRINLLLIFFLFILTVIITVLSKFIIINFINPEYRDSTSIVFILTLSMSFYAIYGINCSYFVHFSKTKLLSLITFYSSIIGLFLNYFLTKSYGIYGASVALMITLVLQLFFTFHQLLKFFPLSILANIKNDIKLLIKYTNK